MFSLIFGSRFGSSMRVIACALVAMSLFSSCSSQPATTVSVAPAGEEAPEIGLEEVDDDQNRDEEGGDTTEFLIVPEGQAVAAPAPETSPAERQRLQDEQVPELDDDTGDYERLPMPEEDWDDVSSQPAVPEAVLPVTPPQQVVPFANDPVDPINAGGDTASTTATIWSEVNPLPPIAPLPMDPPIDELYGIDVEADAVEASEPPADTLTIAEDDSVTGETAVADEAGAVDDEAGAVDEAGVSPDAAPTEEETVDCEARAWARGCPIPVDRLAASVDGESATSDSGANTQDGGDESASNEGVDVPQDVIDILLAPADNTSADPAPAAG